MNLFVSEIVTPPALLPVTSTDAPLARGVVEEIERGVLWRAIVSQTRRIIVNGPLPSHFQIEPITSIVSITRWTPTDAAEAVPAATYSHISADPLGATIFASPGRNWPEPLRPFGSFALTYTAGWEVTDTDNNVPASVQLMVERAVSFRAGSGLGDLTIGSLTLGVADSYKTDRLPADITSIARAYAYRPGIFAG